MDVLGAPHDYLVEDGWIFYPRNPHTKRETDYLPHHPTFRPAPIRARIMKHLNTANLEWVAIECFKRHQEGGDVDGGDATTIVIMLVELPQKSERLSLLLREIHQLAGGLFVELVRGSISRNGVNSREILFKTSYDMRPSMGSAIGNLGMPSISGTLGGYVELFKEADPNAPTIQCALTCRHVAKPSSGDSSSERVDGDFHVPYIRSSGGGDEPPVRIGHPSYDDHERAILDLEGDVKIFQQEEQMWTERLFENPADLEARAGLADVREGIAQHRQHITLLGASDREIGTVFATSGFTVNSKLQLLDWGLVELLPERIGTNKSTFKELKFPTLNYIPAGTQLIKIGKKTGRTFGQANAVESFLASPGKGRGTYLKERVVVPAGGINSIYREGDSGSWVIDPRSHVHGMIRGGRITNDISVGYYFTPLASIIEDIEKVTGYQVRLPQEV